jgi:predicted dehydrogenase
MGLVNKFSQKHNVEVTAVCDVWKVNLERAAEACKKANGRRPRTFTRFNDLLALDDIDAVVIATPDFAHTPILIEALKAGKDAYVEKPMAMEVENANKALELARAKNAVVQVGTQRRSGGKYKAAAQALSEGILENITRVTASVNFNGPRWLRDYSNCKKEDVDWEAYLLDKPMRPFDPKLLRQWQLQKEFSDGISGLWMSHFADAVNMLIGTTYPASAMTNGGTYIWKKNREHCDTYHTLLSYPENLLFDWSMSLGNASGNMFRFYGTNGLFDVYKMTFSGEGAHGPKALKEKKIEPSESENHVENWLKCLRTRQRPNADIEYGHQHSIAAIMAADSLHQGKRFVWDGEKKQVVAG